MIYILGSCKAWCKGHLDTAIRHSALRKGVHRVVPLRGACDSDQATRRHPPEKCPAPHRGLPGRRCS